MNTVVPKSILLFFRIRDLEHIVERYWSIFHARDIKFNNTGFSRYVAYRWNQLAKVSFSITLNLQKYMKIYR